MKQLYEITLKGDGKVIKGTVVGDLRNKQEMITKVLQRNNIPNNMLYKYRIHDIILLVPNSWLDMEDRGIEVN